MTATLTLSDTHSSNLPPSKQLQGNALTADRSLNRLTVLNRMNEVLSAQVDRNDRSQADYAADGSLPRKIMEDLAAARHANDCYREVIRSLDGTDRITGQMVAELLAVGEMHADDLTTALESLPAQYGPSRPSARARIEAFIGRHWAGAWSKS